MTESYTSGPILGEDPHAASRAALWSMMAGCVVLALKFQAWRVTGSVALLSDALESIVNVVAASAALWALRISARPPDEDHPWGHGKVEYFSAGAEGALVLVAAAAIAREAIPRILDPHPLEAAAEGSAYAIAASAINVVLGLWLRRMGRKLRSPALVADGTHVLSDVVTTAGVLVGVGVARLTGWWILDPLCALIVAIAIIAAGWSIVRSSIGGLMDETVPREELDELGQLVDAHRGTALEWHDLRARRSGHRLVVELHLVVDGTTQVAMAHAICDAIERALETAHPGSIVTVHVEPESERRRSTHSSG